MKPIVFIDGQEGTTGLQIYERLDKRADIELILIDENKRKDTTERKKLINEADLVFLCLPDDAARESVTLINNNKTRVIDASVAHRTASEWTYGFPELSKKQRESIVNAKRTTNPGCHSTGAIALLAPLTEAGLVPGDYPIAITSLTGYTGGGKSKIAEYETSDREERNDLNSPRAYSLGAEHKHIPEITLYAGLAFKPAFIPIIADYPQGMQVIIPLHLPGKRREAYDILASHYADCENVDILDEAPPFSASNINAGTDRLTLMVSGSGDNVILTALFDNLGKGACGAAIQNMNIMLGFDEYKGLVIGR